MDERYLFYAMTDPDWFDVPWGGGEPGPGLLDDLAHPDAATGPGWSSRRRGAWAYHRAPSPLPPSGWKVHVSATPAAASGTVDVVAGACARTGTSWKVLRSTLLVRATQAKYAPRTSSGKVCTLYPHDDDALARLLDDLGAGLAGRPGPRVSGEINLPGTPLSLRWGAFDLAWTSTANGPVAAVRGPGGVLLPDDRTRPGAGPGEPPECVRRVQAAAREAAARATLDVHDVRLLHRTTAGGVYAGRRGGRVVVLKEARHHAATDAAGADAPARLRWERAVLERLRGHSIAPDVHELVRCGDSDFLVVEHLEGVNLAQATARRHPASRPGAGARELRAHHAWVERTADQLEVLVGRLHGLGVAHGDLHLGNVLSTPAGLRLVDFEGAALDGEQPSPGMAAPGFDVGDPADPFGRDRACAVRARLVLHVPDAVLLHRRPDLEPEFREVAARGCRGLAPAPAAVGAGPDPAQLAAGLLGCADPSRADRLFPGGVEQFATPAAAAGLLHGAGGVLLALRAAGVGPPPGASDWLARAVEPLVRGRAPWPGLADGAHGVALCLALLGLEDEASRLADALRPADEGTNGEGTNGEGTNGEGTNGEDLSWATGLPGRAVAHRRLAALLGRADLAGLADHLALRAAAAVPTAAAAPASGPSGLRRGWAGTALALRRAALGSEVAVRLEAAAARALHLEEQRLRHHDGGVYGVDGGALLPYLGAGSAAAGLASAALHGTSPDAPGAGLRAAVRRTASPLSVPGAGVLSGRAGLLLTLSRLGGADAGEDCAVAAHRGRLSWHTAPARRGVNVLGAANLRFSADLGTGAAGVLLAALPDGCRALAEVLQLP